MTIEVDSSKQRCMNCGEVVEGKKFCVRCGTKVTQKDSLPNLQKKTEVAKTGATKVAELGISKAKQQIVFYGPKDAELFRCTYQEFATATVESPTLMNRVLSRKTLIIGQQSNGMQITRTFDIPDKYYLLAKTEIESAGLPLQLQSTESTGQEESALSPDLRSRPQRVDNELLTYDPKDENGPRFTSVPVNEQSGHIFNLYVPKTLATFLNNAPFRSLKDISNLLADGDNLSVFGYTIQKSQLLQSLSGTGEVYPFRRKLSNQKLNGGDVQSHEIYLPVRDTQGKVLIISMDQTNLTKLFEGYSNVMDQPQERMLVQDSLVTWPYNLNKDGETVKAAVAQGVLRAPTVESGVIREASISVQAGTTRGERLVNQDTLIAQQVTMADNTIVTLLEVYDGMGGHGSGEKASKEAAKNEITFLTTLTFQQISELKYRAQTNNRSYEVELADAMLQYVADQTPQKIPDDAGTTKTGSIILNGKCVVTSKGDSRTYVFRGGQPVLRTQDHSLVARLVAAGQITLQEASTYAQKNLIYKNAFDNKGQNIVAEHPLQLDVYEIAEIILHDDDVIMSMCDGVIGGLESQGRNPETELLELSQANTGYEAIQALDQFANGGGDNDTFLFARYKKH